ncbi:MAG: ABC transporter substrate-binding protein [SAR324 cluster bacterium]|nr:ABC transporter substrate-binding protein [SAR324 cluster bacterium]
MRTWILCWAVIAIFAGTGSANPYIRGNPEAKRGGLRREHFKVQPHSLHPVNVTDYYGNRVLDLIYESLAATDVETLAHIPQLAERWEISPDKKVFTFFIHPKATWQDGRPVTAEDVKFSFDLLFHKKLKTRAKWMSYYNRIEKAEVLGKRMVRFTVRRDHFLNFVRMAGLRIVPRHRFKGKDPNRTPLTKKPMGSGPYTFKSWTKGAAVKLAMHKNYWGRVLPQNIGRYNAKMLITKIVAVDKVALESFKKGDLDLIRLTPDQWVRETSGADFGMGVASGKKLIKVDVQNKAPRSYRYVGYNLESPLFGDRRVRRAISHLFDRETYIEKFYHGFQVKAVGPFQANSRYSSPRVQPIEFSIPKAIRLLSQAGWNDTDGDNLLDKEGRTFRFTIMTADRETSVKILTLAKEAMRKAGVDLNIKVVDWTNFLKLIDEVKFDAVMLGWSRGPFPDPTALWHSKGAVKGGLNFVRYRNPEVDRLIEKAVKSIPDSERVKLYRRIHEIIYRDQPYTFLLERSHILLAYNSKFSTVKPWYTYAIGENYWWIDRPSL